MNVRDLRRNSGESQGGSREFGQDSYQSYARITGFRADFSGAFFGLKHRKISRISPDRPFCLIRAKVGLRETLVIVLSDEYGVVGSPKFAKLR